MLKIDSEGLRSLVADITATHNEIPALQELLNLIEREIGKLPAQTAGKETQAQTERLIGDLLPAAELAGKDRAWLDARLQAAPEEQERLSPQEVSQTPPAQAVGSTDVGSGNRGFLPAAVAVFAVVAVAVIGLWFWSEGLDGEVTLAADFDAGVAAYDQDDYATALQEFRPLAAQGDARAQFNLGLMYANGEGVTEDDSQAVAWFRQAAAQGQAEAQYNLGLMYANGEGVAEDDSRAVEWYRQAAAQGDARAQFDLGLMYANGEGVVEDDSQAVEWYRQAAVQEYAQAQFNLGVMYANGEGVAEDDNQAVEWYRQAAAQG